MNMMTICFWISLFITFVCTAVLFIKFSKYMLCCGSSWDDDMKPSTIIVIILFILSIFCLILFGYYSDLFVNNPPVQIIYQE